MKYILIIAAIVIIYIVAYLIHIRYVASHSPNPLIVQEDKTFGSGPILKYIAAGDSTAVGEGASKVENTYPYKIAESLAKNNTVQYKNVAVRGARTEDVLTGQVSQMIDYQPDIITISVGANDATHLKSEKQILTNYDGIIKELTAKTSARIYITNIANFTGAKLLPYPFIKLVEWRSSKINPHINAIGTDRVKIINIHDVPSDYSLDSFHPSDKGYNNWYNAFWNQMNK